MKLAASPSAQKGAVLIVGLIMLVLITMMVVGALLLSTTNFKAVGNMQHRIEAAAAAQSAIEAVISSDTNFITPTLTVTPTDARGISVTVAAPVCTKAVAIKGADSLDPNAGSLQQSGSTTIAPIMASGFTTYWDVGATAVSPSTGAKVEVHQGVKLTLSSSVNPCP